MLLDGLNEKESSLVSLGRENEVVKESRGEGDPEDVIPGNINGKGGGAWGDRNRGESSITFAGWDFLLEDMRGWLAILK